MNRNIVRGAEIIIKDWVKVKPWDRLLIVTTKKNLPEARLLKKIACTRSKSVNTLVVEDRGRHVEVFLMKMKGCLIRIRRL